MLFSSDVDIRVKEMARMRKGALGKAYCNSGGDEGLRLYFVI
jgi:hypothetical protein